MTDHDFVLPYPEATTRRCCNCGAGEDSPKGREPCQPVKSWMEHRAKAGDP